MTKQDGERPPRDEEIACFEAGIKFGSLYHQFTGTPVSPASVPSLSAAMEKAIENQPHCQSVTVTIDTDAVAEATDPTVGYTELTGRFLEVELVVDYKGTVVTGSMRMVDGYPLMQVDALRQS